jgi:threonine dehydratase
MSVAVPRSWSPIPLDEIRAARRRIEGSAIRSPLVRLNVDDPSASIYLKLESLQPVGSFKQRGASNALALMDDAGLRAGVWTASAGNMAQALAWCARQRGAQCTVVVPDHAPSTKLQAITRFGARIVKVPFSQWVDLLSTRVLQGVDGTFIHPFSDSAVMAGNGTIGLEIYDEAPDVDAVVIPYGGGGLSCGIASALRALKPAIRIFAAEVATAAPFAASLAVGRPTTVEYHPSFVDGIGAPVVFPEMWRLAKDLLDGSLVASLEEVAAAIRLLVERNRVVAEGAGATSVASALSGRAGAGRIVCIVSGGNIDASRLARILDGHTQ